MTATIILYINAGLGLLLGQVWAFPIGTLLVVGQAAAGLGVANEKKWGYWLGVGLTALFAAYLVYFFSFYVVLNLIFYIALLCLLLHPMSRSYRKVWFR
jgi:hypothetical protein